MRHGSALRRFLKAPKGILIVLLALLAALAAVYEGPESGFRCCK